MTLMTRTVLLVCLLAAVPLEATAQTVTDERAWFNLTLQERGSTDSPWRWTLEIYLRSREGLSELDLIGLRPTVFYALNSRSSLGGGYAVVPSFPAAGGTATEHRVFGQYQWAGPVSGGSLSLRTRIEARMIEGNSGTQGRLRQQARYSHPIAGSRVSLVAYDEIFVHMNETSRNARGVEQNRASGGVSIAASGAVRVDVGYVHQFYPGHRGAPDRINHVLSSTLVVSF
jgi:hypothetical protein